jgi:hypothetical protein
MTVGTNDNRDQPTVERDYLFQRLVGRGTLTLGKGTYVIDGGDVNVNSGARLSCVDARSS